MARHNAALCMAQCRAHVGQLPFTGVTAHLGHRLGEAEHRTGVAGMTIRQHASVSVHGFAAAGPADAAGQPGAAFALLTDPDGNVLEILQEDPT